MTRKENELFSNCEASVIFNKGNKEEMLPLQFVSMVLYSGEYILVNSQLSHITPYKIHHKKLLYSETLSNINCFSKIFYINTTIICYIEAELTVWLLKSRDRFKISSKHKTTTVPK